MGPFIIVESHPVAEFEVEVLPRGELVDAEEILLEYPPPPLDLAVGLRTAHPRVLVPYPELRHHLLEGMERFRGFRMRREFFAVVGEDCAEPYSTGSEPLRRVPEEEREGLRFLVGQKPRERYPRGIVDERREVLLFLRVAPFHVLRLVDVDMAEFARHFLLVPDDAGFPFGLLRQFRGQGFEFPDRAGEGFVVVPDAFMEDEISDLRPFEYFADRVPVDGILRGYFPIFPSGTGKACHLAPHPRRDFGVLMHRI